MTDASKFTIGKLRSRITFETLSRSDDDQGGFTETWTELVTVWAHVRPVSSRERFFSDQIQYQRSHEVVIRHRDDITQEMRFTFDSRTFQIKGVRSPDEKGFWLVIDAEENQGT